MRILKKLFGLGAHMSFGALFFLKAFVLSIVVLMVLGELIVSIWSAVDWGLILSLLPDWLVPDALLSLVEGVEASQAEKPLPPYDPNTPEECTRVEDGIEICPEFIRLPDLLEGGRDD